MLCPCLECLVRWQMRRKNQEAPVHSMPKANSEKQWATPLISLCTLPWLLQGALVGNQPGRYQLNQRQARQPRATTVRLDSRELIWPLECLAWNTVEPGALHLMVANKSKHLLPSEKFQGVRIGTSGSSCRFSSPWSSVFQSQLMPHFWVFMQ